MASKLKIAVMGGGGVGKSALTVRFTKNEFLVTYDPTIEDTYAKDLEIDGKSYSLAILDTAGQEEFDSLRDQYARQNDVFVLVFSLTDRNTFQELKDFVSLINRSKDSDSVPYVVLGNKSDMANERKVSKEEGEAFVSSINGVYFETSAKDNINVDEAFTAAAKKAVSVSNANAAVAGKPKKKKSGGCLLI